MNRDNDLIIAKRFLDAIPALRDLQEMYESTEKEAMLKEVENLCRGEVIDNLAPAQKA